MSDDLSGLEFESGRVADALEHVASIANALTSSNCPDSELEESNIVDMLHDCARAMRRIGAAITPNVCGGNDHYGGHVESLTEAVMGHTRGLADIADAIRELARAVKESERG